MRTYEILDLAGQRSRRTIADALAVLQSLAAFGEHDRAEIRVGLMPLVPRKYVGLAQIVFDVPCSEQSYAVPLPSAEFFRAYSVEGQRERYGIELLDRGIVDGRGNVRLADGQTLRAIEIEPTRLPLKPTALDWRIVHLAIECCRVGENSGAFSAREKCYRALGQCLRSEDAAIAYMLPDMEFVDCSELTDLMVPSLDAIAAYWAEVYPGERAPSLQKIANTLADFRMRFPRRL